MAWHSKIVLASILSVSIPTAVLSQADVCQVASPYVPNEARAELLRIEAAERLQRETERRAWEVKMIPVKYALSENTLQPLCIFKIEVVSQPTLRLVQIRAPKELMPTVEDALRRLDVAQPVAKNVELTGYVLVSSSDPKDTPGLRPVPAALQPVVTQLKTALLPDSDIFLADTIVVRGTDGGRVDLMSPDSTTISANIVIREGTPPVVRLNNLSLRSHNTAFTTGIDVPVGSQVIVGKGTAQKRAVIIVVTARILD